MSFNNHKNYYFKSALSLICLLFISFPSLFAQEKSPLTSQISTKRINDSIVNLEIKLTPSNGLQIFTTHKMNADDAFVSTFTIDSSLSALVHSNDKITEQGEVKTVNDPDAGQELHYFDKPVTFIIPLHIASDTALTLTGSFSWLGKLGNDFPNEQIAINQQIQSTTAAKGGDNVSAASDAANDNTLDTKASAWKIFLTSFLIGLAMVFTPCVFPLIPVTVSFFLKKSKGRADGIKNALTYSICIILIYTVPAFIITMIFGDSTLYQISTSVVANLLFFAIFIIFAISFFGAFELTLPNKWANATDSGASKGGFVGIFFMALTLVIVSFSCTGPFVGSLLAKVSGSGAKMAAVIGMLGISSGLAIPFSLFAFFPSMLKTLPKSGGWLNSVKVVFGFIELALAMKFLSNVDLIYGWHLLDREIFLSIWIVLAILTGCYLLGKIKFSHDSELKFVSIPRLIFAIISFVFAVYLFPGLWGAPLKAMSGLLPPPSTQDFDLNQLQYKIGSASSTAAVSSNGAKALPPKLYTDKIKEAPFGLTTYFDYDEGMAAAKALNKPVMLDFTGHSCVNCRKMENEVWSNPDVLKRLKDDFVIISLYTDENSNLPVDQVYTNKKGEKITTLAQKARDIETSQFGMISQPLYMFVDLQGKPLSNIKYGYDPDIQKFIKHLDTVKSEFAKR